MKGVRQRKKSPRSTHLPSITDQRRQQDDRHYRRQPKGRKAIEPCSGGGLTHSMARHLQRDGRLEADTAGGGCERARVASEDIDAGDDSAHRHEGCVPFKTAGAFRPNVQADAKNPVPGSDEGDFATGDHEARPVQAPKQSPPAAAVATARGDRLEHHKHGVPQSTQDGETSSRAWATTQHSSAQAPPSPVGMGDGWGDETQHARGFDETDRHGPPVASVPPPDTAGLRTRQLDPDPGEAGGAEGTTLPASARATAAQEPAHETEQAGANASPRLGFLGEEDASRASRDGVSSSDREPPGFRSQRSPGIPPKAEMEKAEGAKRTEQVGVGRGVRADGGGGLGEHARGKGREQLKRLALEVARLRCALSRTTADLEAEQASREQLEVSIHRTRVRSSGSRVGLARHELSRPALASSKTSDRTRSPMTT